jgi:hypothetical protein
MLRIEQGPILLKGVAPARIFSGGHHLIEIEPEANLAELLSPGAEKYE